MVLMSWVFHWVCSRLQAHENLTLITLMQASPAQLVAVARKLATCCRSRFGAAQAESPLLDFADSRIPF